MHACVLCKAIEGGVYITVYIYTVLSRFMYACVNLCRTEYIPTCLCTYSICRTEYIHACLYTYSICSGEYIHAWLCKSIQWWVHYCIPLYIYAKLSTFLLARLHIYRAEYIPACLFNVYAGLSTFLHVCIHPCRLSTFLHVCILIHRCRLSTFL
jgi:hypothetical protein